LYQGIKFPPNLPDGYFEPNGNKYGLYNEWHKVQEEINWLKQLRQQESTSETTATVTGLSASSTIETGTTVLTNTTTLVASSNIVSNANTQEVLNATMVTTNAVCPSSEMPRGNNYCPQADWNRQSGLMSHVSFFNTYLAESKELSPFPLKCFWQFGEEVWTIFGGKLVPPESI
jgi:hypothetical protein